MLLTSIIACADQFAADNNVSIPLGTDTSVVAQMYCHDALHNILNLNLSDDEMESESVESDVLCVQNAIRLGFSLSEILERELEYIPGLVNLTEAHVSVMFYFFNLV